jgi:purine-cytosine permease-like protein
MLSMWWVIVAFLLGGCAGILVMALMHMAGGLPKQLAQAPDLNGLPW